VTHPDATRIAAMRALCPRLPIPMFDGAARSHVMRALRADVVLAVR